METQIMLCAGYLPYFIVTCKSKRLLEEKIRPAVENYLAVRGLTLSEEKTLITYIRDGFTFLGQTFRKHGPVLRIKPAKEGVLALMLKVGALIKKHVSAPMPALIKKLNQCLRGWANYHRHVVSSEAFSRIDKYVFEQLWRMLIKRHPKKSKRWLYKKYWKTIGQRSSFTVIVKNKRNVKKIYQVLQICSIGTKRHIKIKAAANPYDPKYGAYFWRRRNVKGSKLFPALSAREYRSKLA